MKTFNLTLTLATAAAVLGAGCQRPQPEWSASGPTRFCVDKANQRVDERYCAPNRSAGGFLPYFIGHGGYIPPYGGYARGGGYAPAAGVRYGAPAGFTRVARGFSGAIARGGFGGSARGFGAGA